MAKLFGVDDVKAAEADYDSIAIVQTQPASHSVRVWLRIGTGDNSAPGLIESQQKFAAAAARRRHDRRGVQGARRA